MSRANSSARYTKLLVLIFFNVLALLPVLAFAGSPSITTIQSNLESSFQTIASIMTMTSYLAGGGFALGAILKFKQHKDNPTQIPIGTPIALVFIAAALMFLPVIYKVAGTAVFGSSASSGNLTGGITF